MRKSILTLDWGVAAILAALSLSCASILSAQNPPAPAEQPPTSAPSQDPPAETPPALLPHLETDRVWLSGQANFISQYHPVFHPPSPGPNSFPAKAQDPPSRLNFAWPESHTRSV